MDNKGLWQLNMINKLRELVAVKQMKESIE